MRDWTRAALIRAIKTFAQAAAGYLSLSAPEILAGTMLITEIDWGRAISIGLFAAIYSMLMNVKGLPEVKGQQPIELTEVEALAEIMANPDVMGYEFEEIDNIPDEEAEEEDE